MSTGFNISKFVKGSPDEKDHSILPVSVVEKPEPTTTTKKARKKKKIY